VVVFSVHSGVIHTLEVLFLADAGSPCVTQPDRVHILREVLDNWRTHHKRVLFILSRTIAVDSAIDKSQKMHIEVRGFEEGFENSWTEGFVAIAEWASSVPCVNVDFVHFIDSDTDEPEQAVCRRELVRPIPPASLTTATSFKVGDEVDVRIDDCWWEGEVKKIQKQNLTVVLRCDCTEHSVAHSQVRLGVTLHDSKWQLRCVDGC
jgi:hypothetical protein